MKKSCLESCLCIWLIIVVCCGLMEVSPQQAPQCGMRTKRRKRVIGGYEAQRNSWPWLVNMLDKADALQYCSGVIIRQQWILTAAHCFIYYGPNSSAITLPVTKYKYIVADHNYNVTDPYEYVVEPSQLFIHPNYKLADDKKPGDNDIALIKLKNPLRFSKQVKQACLPARSTKFDTTASCYLAGWGNTVNTDGYNRSLVLREVPLKLVPFARCNSKRAFDGKIPKHFRCAGYARGGKDGCYGDSGAPLQCIIQGRWAVAGIMSWGSGCGTPNRYGVYTDVQQMLPFINPVLKGTVNRLTTYHKRPLSRFKKSSKLKQRPFYSLFLKKTRFTELDLVRNYQFNPLQISLLKSVTLEDYAFVMDACVSTLVSKIKPTRLHTIVAEFQRNFKKFQNYDKLREVGKKNNINVTEVIKKSGASKADLLNASRPLKMLKKSVNSLSG